MKADAPAGHVAGLYLRATALAQGDPRALQAFLQGQSRATAKALIADTADATWAGGVAPPAAVTDFLAAMLPYSALLQLPLRRVPARTRVLNASTAVGAAVVAEGAPAPIQVRPKRARSTVVEAPISTSSSSCTMPTWSIFT